MKNGTEKYIGTVEYLSRLYDYCNAKLFGGELVKPVITVQQDAKNKTNGWWSVGKVWKWTERIPAGVPVQSENGEYVSDSASVIDCEEHELNMTAQQLNRPLCATDKDSICSTLIHEMCHQYAQVNNMQDTSRAGNYHNKLFKQIAEKHGLHVECVATIGWSHTTLTDDTAAIIAEFVKDNPDTVIYRIPVFKGQCVKTSSTRKYICPVCGQSVRATKAVNIMCADCNELMQEE